MMAYTDISEHEQFDEALNYIEAYPSTYSDEEMKNILNGFQICDKEVRSVQSIQKHTLNCFNVKDRWNYDISDKIITSNFNVQLTYKQGLSEDQLKLLKGILLSAGFNYNLLQNRLLKDRIKVDDDILNDTYGGRTPEYLESLRLKAANCIKKADRFYGKLAYLGSFGKYIYDGLKKIAEYKLIKEAAEKSLIYETAKRMLNDGVSLEKIVRCLKPSAEEEEIIKNIKTEETKEEPSESRKEKFDVTEKLPNYTEYSYI